jgi:hypothetical protein
MNDEEESTFDATPITTTLVSVPSLKPSRRSPLSYYTSAAKRSFRDAFSRQQLIEGVKAFLWVAPLTILIWIYAEREQLATQKNFPIPIEVRSSDPRQVIEITSVVDGTVKADLVGPRAQLDRVREEFARTDARARIEIGSVQPGTHEVSADAVAEDSRFAGNGVVLNRIEPQLLRVSVDVLEDVDVPVMLPPDVTNILNPVFNPATVRLTAPRKLLASAPKPLKVYVDSAALQQLKPGTTSAPRLPLTIPFQDRNARLSVSTVDGTFEVKQADEEITLPSIPVWHTAAPGIEQKYNMPPQFELTLPSVTLIGPSDKIKEIEQGVRRVKATFDVSEENITPGTDKQHALLKYDLPEGVKVKADQAKRMIEYTLTPKE